MTPATLEVGDILRAHGAVYQARHPVTHQQGRVLRRLTECRTAALGGHVDACSDCGFTRISYNSCRDRHCPKCQASKRAAWLETRLERLLPVGYFHVVFTLPALLSPLVLHNQRLLYDLLFRAASATLLTLAADPQRLGAQVGITAILGATQVFRYLGRYSHRVAIANSRLASMEHDRVSFRWKDYSDNHRTKVMTVSAEEFIRRLLLHVLPKGFVRIRHFGLLASVNVATKLQRCRQLLGQETPSGPQPAKCWVDRVLEWTGQDPRRCPHCHGFLERRPLLKSLPEEGQQPDAVLATHRHAEEVRADSS